MTAFGDSAQIIRDLLAPVLSKLNIDDYILDISDGKSKGDGYSGEAYTVKVKQKSEETCLFAKLAERNDEYRKFVDIKLAYINEVAFYTETFPVLDEFQREKQVRQPVQIAKCYATSVKEKEEALILEDLRVAGFGMWNRKKPLDEAHLSFALKNYGKLHALSFALRDQHPEKFNKIADSLIDLFPVVFVNFMEGFKKEMFKNAEMLKQRGLIAEAELTEKVAHEIEEIYALQCEANEPRIVTHGDSWCNNMMFQYDSKTGEPVEIRFIDFQNARFHSPAFDIAYFFYTAASERALNEVDRYLKIYYDSFSDFLRELGSNPEAVFPFEAFLNHWRKFRRFGLVLGIFGFRFILAEPDEAPAFTSGEYEQAFDAEVCNQEEINMRVTNVVKHFVKNGTG